MNSYLLVDAHAALLIDAGMTAHAAAQIDALQTLLERDNALAIVPTRTSEFAPICNVQAIAEARGVDRLFGAFGDAIEWADFQPPSRDGEMLSGHWARGITSCRGRAGDRIAVDPAGQYRVEVLAAPIRLLPTFWVYDDVTHALFTADMFTQPSTSGARGAEVIDDPAEIVEPRRIYEHLIGARYWWLAGANTEPIRAGLLRIFDDHEVAIIAPAYGPIISGRAAVERQLDYTLEALLIAGHEQALDVR